MKQIKKFYVIKRRSDGEFLKLSADIYGEDVITFEQSVLNADKFKDEDSALKELRYHQNCDVVEMVTMEADAIKNAIIPPKGFKLHQTVYMIPTKYNGLKEITAYNILDFSLSDIGKRANLSICKKERGIEPFYCASFEMFNTSIFATKEQAAAQQEKLRGGTNG